MDWKDILKALSVEESLSEDQKEEIITKLNDIVDIKVAERVEEALEDAKTSLITEYEEKFEDYKKDITSKFSNFVDEVLEEEMVIPENILEFARLGELYSDLVEAFKVRIGIDEGVLDQEARDLLKEARDEIIRLQEELNEQTEKALNHQQDAQELALETYRHMVTAQIPADHRKKVLTLLESTTTKEETDRKLKFIMDNRLFEVTSTEDDDPGTGQVTINEDVESDKKGKDKPTDEESPFDMDKKRWVEILKGR